MTGALVDAHDGFLRRTGRQAEDLAGLRIEPGVLEVDALVVLDGQVALVRFAELLRGHAEEAIVDIHELGHRRILLLARPPLITTGSDGGGAWRVGHRGSVIGRPDRRSVSRRYQPVLHSRPHGEDREE